MSKNSIDQSKFDQLHDEIADLIQYRRKSGQKTSPVALTLLEEIRAYQEAMVMQNVVGQSSDDKLTEINYVLKTQIENAEFLRDEATAELEIQKALLFQQSKMAAMGEMIGVIAHQLKQPITMQLLHLDTLLELHEENTGITKFAKIIEAAKKNILHMDETINVFSRFLAPNKKKLPFKVGEAIGVVQNIMQPHLKLSNVQFEIKAHEDFYVNGYPNEFKHVILNLIINARDALVDKNKKNGLVLCAFSVSSKTASISIRDNGGGIPEHLLPDALFQLHISTKGDKGSGIGLQISKKIIEEHMGGRLWAHNVGEGAEFVIELPLLEEKSP